MIKNYKEEKEKKYLVRFENKYFTCNCVYFKKSFQTFCKHVIKIAIIYSIDFNLLNEFSRRYLINQNLEND